MGNFTYGGLSIPHLRSIIKGNYELFNSVAAEAHIFQNDNDGFATNFDDVYLSLKQELTIFNSVTRGHTV